MDLIVETINEVQGVEADRRNHCFVEKTNFFWGQRQ